MWVKVFILISFFGGFALSENLGECDIADISEGDWTVSYTNSFYDNEIGKNIFLSTYNGKIENLKCTCSSCKRDYVKFDTNATHFYIATTDDLKHFDEDMLDSVTNTLVYLCKMSCNVAAKQSDLLAQLTVLDYNDYPPEFADGNRTYMVSSPIMPRADFSVYGAQIQATDLDFSNKDMKFKLTPDDFEIITSVDKNKKPNVYVPSFKAKKIMQITEPITYTLTATDSGTAPGPRSSSIELTLVPDPQYTLDVPSFVYPDGSSASYSFRYEKNDVLTPLGGMITVQTMKSSAAITRLRGDLSEYFEPIYDKKSGQITLKISKTVKTTSSFTILSLSIETDSVATTSIVIYFSDVPSVLKFGQRFYTATYDDIKNEVNLDQSIELTSDGDPKIVWTGDLADRLSLVPDETPNLYKIKVDKPLTVEEIQSRNYLNLTIEATVGTDSDTCGLLVTLPVHVLEFTQNVYTATYTKDDKVIVDEKHPIVLSSNSGVNLTVEDDYSKYFKMTLHSDKTYKIDVESHLSDTILAKNEITFTITAKDKYNNLPQAVIRMALPVQDNTTAPTFSETYYVVQYERNNTGYIDFKNPITFENVAADEVEITLKEFGDKFLLKYETSKWRIKIENPLDPNMFLNTSQLVTTMEASQKDGTKKGSSVLVIELINSVGRKEPAFKEAYYTADYPQDDKTIFYFDNEIIFENYDDLSKVKIEASDYPKNFAISYNPVSKKWEIKITKPLTITDSYIVTKLIATIEDIAEHPVATFVLNLPEAEPEVGPIFDNAYYTATYAVQNNSGVVTFEKDIEFVNRNDMSDIEIVSDEYFSYFSFDYTDDKWQMTSSLLDVNKINKTDMVISITATDKTNKLTGRSVIDLKLPSVNTDGAPKFSKTYYTGKYLIDSSEHTVELDDISITNKADLSEIKIVTDKYRGNFDFSYEGGKWMITVKENLDNTILDANADVVMGLLATEDTNPAEVGQSVLVLSLPIKNVQLGPKFSKNQYYGNYTVGDSPILDVEYFAIKNKDNEDDIDLSFSSDDGDFTENFNITRDSTNGVWKMQKKNSLDVSKIENKTQLVFTITATEKGNDNKGISTLIMMLTNDNIEDDTEFTEIHYTGSYDNSGEKPVVKMDKNIQVTTSKDISTMIVKFERTDDFNPSDYFTLNKNLDHYDVTVDNPLTADILKEQKSLAMTLVANFTDTKTYSTLVLNLPTQTVTFDSPLYNAEYNVDIDDDVNFSADDITLVTEGNSADVEVYLDSIYDVYFKLEINGKNIKLTKKSDLPSEIYKKETVITLTLVAKITGSTVASAAVNVKIGYEGTGELLHFDSILYNGKYEIKNKMATIEADAIKLASAHPEKVYVVITNSYQDFFNVSYSDSDVILKPKENVPEGTFKDLSSVSILLSASLRNTDIKDSAVVNLRIVNDDEPTPDIPGVLSFNSVSNTAQYSLANEKGILKLDHPIGITTDRTNEEIITSIGNDSGLEGFFNSSYSKQEFKIELSKDLPEDVFLSNTFVTLILTASIRDTDRTVNSVLTVKFNKDQIVDDKYISFSSPIYAATYEIQNNEASVTNIDEISIDTNEEAINITVSITNGHDKYFNTSYSNKKISLTLISSVASSTLRSLNNIPVVLLAKIKNTLHNSTAVVNFKVEDNDSDVPTNNSTISFSKILYQGKYAVESNQKIDFTVDTIDIITDKTENEIVVEIDKGNVYGKYFNATYNHAQVAVSPNGVLPEDVLENNNIIALSMTAYVKNSESVRCRAVLNVELDHDQNIDNRYITFTNPVYAGVYEIQNNKASLSHIDKIKLNTDEEDANINVTIINGYDADFETSYTEKEISLSLRTRDPSSILRSLSNIPVVLLAEIKDSLHNSTTVVNFKVRDDDSGNITNSEIIFSSLLYHGKYTVEKDKVDFIVTDKINVITDKTENEIEITITNKNAYEKYFSVSYSHTQVTVRLNGTIPEHVLEERNVIELVLNARVIDGDSYAQAILNVDLINTSGGGGKSSTSSKTGYIAAISVLAILLGLVLLASAALYFFKLRHREDDKMSEDEYVKSHVKFDKTANRPSGDKMKHSSAIDSRRPTGFIFRSNEDEPRDSTSDPPPSDMKERKKSVVFDENVEKLQVETVDDEDVEKGLDESERD